MSNFLDSAASRETSPELMEAILAVAENSEATAEAIWASATREEALAVWERVTKHGRYSSGGVFWGAEGSRWAAAYGLRP